MWQKLTETARRVVFFAQEEAARMGENYVSTEHFLLGIARQGDSVAGLILESLGVPLTQIRSEIERELKRGPDVTGQDMELTPRTKLVIDLANDEAREMNDNYIGSEHLLLGLIRENEGLAGRVLSKLGVTLEPTRRAILALRDGMTSLDTLGRLVTMQAAALSPEQQAALAGDGVPFAELPLDVQKPVEALLLAALRVQPQTRIDLADALIRLRATKTEDGGVRHVVSAHFAVSVAFTEKRPDIAT